VATVALAAQPAAAAGTDEAAVRARLADVAAQAAQNDASLAQLEVSIAGHERRAQEERAQLQVIARFLYEQPDNQLLSIAQSPSVSEALGRVSDMVGTAARARAMHAALDRDLVVEAAEQEKLQRTQVQLAAERQELDPQYQQLLILDATPVAEVPAPTPEFTGSLPDLIRQTWAPLGSARADWAVRLAQCESGLNPYAFNRSSAASGLFQFLPSTWAGTPWHAQSPFDAASNAAAAAWLYRRSGAGQWQCSYRIGWS